jgi:hypothetical protein
VTCLDTFNSLPEKLLKIKSNLSLTQAIAEILSLFPGSVIEDNLGGSPTHPPRMGEACIHPSGLDQGKVGG